MASTTTTSTVSRSVESEERKEGKQKPFKVFGAGLSVRTEFKCCHPLFLCSSCICLDMCAPSYQCSLLTNSNLPQWFSFVHVFYLGHWSTSFIHMLNFGWACWTLSHDCHGPGFSKLNWRSQGRRFFWSSVRCGISDTTDSNLKNCG